MLIEDVEQLRLWLVATLAPITKEDPPALAKYVLALVKKDKPLPELKESCVEQLDIFLQSKTKEFVEKVFEVLEKKSYILKRDDTVNNTSTVSGSKRQNTKHQSSAPGRYPKKFKHRQVPTAPLASNQQGKSKHRPASTHVRVPAASQVNQDANFPSGKIEHTPVSNFNTKVEVELKDTLNMEGENSNFRLQNSSPKTKPKDLKDDWLDYIEVQETFVQLSDEETEELVCSRKRGRGCLEARYVPRLPLRAMIERIRLQDESSGLGRHSGGRGRARILQDLASRPHGLHKKKPEKMVASEKKEVVKNEPATRMEVDRSVDLYNWQWQQEDFPSLGTEQTVNSSPRKMNTEEQCNGATAKKDSIYMKQSGDSKNVQTDIVKPKSLSKKKFNFSKANQELLQEFPMAQHPGPKLFRLTQHNLERFLRESDSESCSSQENLNISHNTSQDMFEDLPVYQKYAVTLDDIRKSKASKVPPKVKGHLANLLEAVDAYCANPDTYFERRKELCKAESMPIAQVAADTLENNSVGKERTRVVCYDDLNKQCSIVDTPYPQSSENIEGTFSNVSVVSDLSTLDSPSENNPDISIADVGESMDDTNDDANIKNETAECQNSVNIGLQVGNEFNSIDGTSEAKIQSTMNGVSNEQETVWRIYGKNTIQVDGLPHNCDVADLHGMVSGFGTVVDFQIRKTSTGTSVRFKLNSEDACEYAVQCLDETDCLFPDNNCKLMCHQLQS